MKTNQTAQINGPQQKDMGRMNGRREKVKQNCRGQTAKDLSITKPSIQVLKTLQTFSGKSGGQEQTKISPPSPLSFLLGPLAVGECC